MNRRSAAVMNWRNRTKLKLVEYKGGKCSKCGYDKPIPSVYEFHHRNPKDKDFSISGKSWSYDRLKKEADKCDLFCRNCHAEVHDELIQESRSFRMGAVKAKRLTKRKCKRCNENYQPKTEKQKYCSAKCCKIFQRKVAERPSKEQLLREVEETNWCAVGRKYGVTDNTIRKWIKLHKTHINGA
jgi:hypothetical protein